MTTQTITSLNDSLRETLLGGRVIVTHGIMSVLNADGCDELIERIKDYDGFLEPTEREDEHDFGIVLMNGNTFIWKIDYYSADMSSMSFDPTDTDVTQRVMTIMLSKEYGQ